MERDRLRERTARALSSFESGTLDRVAHLAEEELPAMTEDSELLLRSFKVDSPRLCHHRPDPSLEVARFLRTERPTGPDAKSTSSETLPFRRHEYLPPRPDPDHAARIVTQRHPPQRLNRRPFRIDDEQMRGERDTSHDNPLGLKSGERIRARERGMLTGEFERDPHVSPIGQAGFKPPNRHVQVGSCGARRVARLRPFAPNDIPSISTIVKDALRENYPATLYLDIYKWWREGFLIAEEDNQVVGFLAGVNNAPHNARILMLAVLTTFRRRGIGSALMDEFLRQCALRALRTVELEVRLSNADAIRFYSGYGFQISGTLPRFYTDGEDGYKMMRHL